MPAGLDELVPTCLQSVPSDPYDGQKLRFKKLTSGYVIYSLGEDARDDGGAELDPKKQTAGHDTTFIVER